MKTIINSILTIILVSFFASNLSAQDKHSKTDTTKFEVKGNCEMCKGRIENAALIKGVKWVEWDKATDTLTVIYRVDKTKLIEIHKSIAEVGHTTDLIECNIDAYNKLPACCAYMGDAEKH
ncbi:MAG: heavy-metal-associated domain-containing protein [Bacteroidales bacterium]|nr:heavy-metal-associated domain-containing protein [Bacteroidales bacterium]